MSSLTMEMLQTQLQSARKSLLFMETQHATTLKGLHAEIQNLQKKCSELTFEVAMKEDKEEPDHASEDLIQKLKGDVSDLTEEKVRMLQLLEEKDRQFVELESHAISQEKKYLNELKVKNHRTTALSGELETRSNTIGYLTAQLHQARSKIHSLTQQKSSPSVTPAPPNIPRSSARFHRSTKSVEANFRPLSSGSKDASAELVRTIEPVLIARPSSASSVSAVNLDKLRRPLRKSGLRFSPSPMPDPTPFFSAAECPKVLSSIRPPSVLPPINKRSDSARDANGNPAYSMTSYSTLQCDERQERFSSKDIALRRCNLASPDKEIKGNSTRTPVGDGATM